MAAVDQTPRPSLPRDNTQTFTEPPQDSSFDLPLVKSFISNVLRVACGASQDELDDTIFSSPEWEDQITRFCQDTSLMGIYVSKIRDTDTEDIPPESEDYTGPTFTYRLSTEMTYSPAHVATLAFIKRVPSIDTLRTLDSQVHFLNLPGPAPAEAALTTNAADGSTVTTTTSSPYEALHNLVHLAVAPFFEAYVNSKSGGRVNQDAKLKDADAKMGIPMAKKKIAELELSLLHLQQNVEIPDIYLSIHPIIQRTVDKCRAEGSRVTPEAMDPALLSDTTFLNRIQSEVNSWIKEIQNVTKLNREVGSGTASQEINFWLSMERALEGVEEQLRSEPISLTLETLKHAKRFRTTVSFIADTGLKEATDVVHKYNLLMKDFPLNELLAATDLEKIEESLVLIFGHINKKLKLSPYPIRRALPLVEAISRDLTDQLLKVLGSQRLMYQEYDYFERAMASTANVFRVWDELIKEFTNVAREVTRKRNEKFIPIKINPAHAKLQERASYLRQFRKQHEQLRVMTGPTKGLMGNDAKRIRGAGRQQGATALLDVDMEEEVRAAYDRVKTVDVLDVSPEGTEIWVAAETAYNEGVARVENQIIARLRDRLATARNATDMTRIFSQFNALFVRPKIRGAIQEYQSQLIDSIREDIRHLHDKFKTQYRYSEAYHMSQLRDLPPIAGAITWAKQIERQLSTYMKRVEDVLGKGWELYAEGQKLQSESVSFRRKLDTRPIYEAWLHEINRRDMHISGRLFEITKNRALGGVLQLSVNFDSQIIVLFKECRNLLWLNFQVPHTINNIAKDAKRVYPHAVSLMESVRTYAQTVAKMNQNQGIVPLVAEYRNTVQQKITQGMSMRWEWFVSGYESRHQLPYLPGTALEGRESRHTAFVREFASTVSLFQDRTDALIEMYEDISKIIEDLATCTYTAEAFSELLARIQKTIDRLNLEGYANLDSWVTDLDSRIEAVLVDRLRAVIGSWCAEFSKDTENENARERDVRTKETNKTGLQLTPLRHEVRIRNQVIYLDPPLEYARQNWYGQLHQWLGVVCGLKRIQSSRYEIGLKFKSTSRPDTLYTSLLGRFSESTLEKPYALVEEKIRHVSAYVNKWLQFQSLWDLESEAVYNRLGDDLALWQQLLLEIRKTRSTFDNSETQRSFGVAVVNYEQVQSKVNAKYDTWQRDVLARFGGKLASSMKETHAAILKARNDLEHHSIEGSSTAQAVTFITFVQDLKRKVKKWTPQIEIFTTGQKTLERQRYQFPADWLYVDQVEGEWSAFNEILGRKNATIQEQLAGLQLKIVAEDKIIQNRIAETLADWEANKPIQGSLKADIAMNSINIFEGKVNRLKDDADMVSRAKEALDLELVRDVRMDPILEEIRDLKAVWTALSGVWNQIAELRESPWASIQPRKLRQQLDGLINSTRELPSRMRQYAAFEFVQETLRGHLKSNLIISELKSEALRERHWRQLYKILRISGQYSPSQMTLGSVWDLDLKRNEGLIKEVITQAAGEMALEEFLRQVKETWNSYSLELVNYQNKTRLIRGWDDLFTKCGENLNSLTAMKLSPYYKVFEEDASLWEDRLNRIHVLFDVWIDVQRQWVYLEGIFSGSADIKHLLPVESNRFNNINTEFLTVMKKVFKSPFVLDVLNIQGVQKSLERLAEQLSRIQKALGEYLERERSSFPRFYFVGDEDLLEIIGNSKDILRIMKHLKKMFAGIANIKLDQDLTTILGMVSREGEEVEFSTPIPLKDFPKINDWLTKLETEMRVTLARRLSQGFAQLDQIYLQAEALDRDALLAWIDAFPAQLVVLAAQIAWTRSVEASFAASSSLEGPLNLVLRALDVLADAVLSDLPPLKRTKCEHLITELVHQRDVIRSLQDHEIHSSSSFDWLYKMRFYLDSTIQDPLRQLSVKVSDAVFSYGYEYLGVPDRLVQTPLTDRCYLTLTTALKAKLGGSPFGPAGTGKTESVKALGLQLGRFVLVFCCDETFDFQAMGRIFVGLCRVGAFGCFDEINRLEERILSAVSQQVQVIQQGLAATVSNPAAEIELVGKTIRISPDTGIFITLNPGYAGRSNLPDNLKKLFRSIAMTKPDREMIAQVLLFSQGFRTAEVLASKIVPFFNLCSEQLSSQPHYDFGLRALKAVLVSAGHLKRKRIQNPSAVATTSEDVSEQEIVIQSVTETIVPKLVAEDVPLLKSLLADVFPGIDYIPVDLDQLKEHINQICIERRLVASELWMQKTLQLYQILTIQHGLMLVGPSATGKTQAWQVLLAALERLTGVEGVSYVIDPKAISKESLYGTLDSTTREWNDGLFTHILRKIVDNVRGEDARRHWIIFDGDVDPEWVENLNSVLDDNKLLTLPNGERLNLPSNVRIMFEVESLRYATLATVSRCGMVWFSDDTVVSSMVYQNYLQTLRAVPLDATDDDASLDLPTARDQSGNVQASSALTTQRFIADTIEPYFGDDGLVEKSLRFASTVDHIMDFTSIRALTTLFSLMNKTTRNIIEYNSQHPDFPLQNEQVESYITKRLLVGIVWAFTGDSRLETRATMGDFLRDHSGLDFPPLGPGASLIDYDVQVTSGDWNPWQSSVPTIEIETHAVTSADVVIPTLDTVRHEEVLYSWLSEHKPLMLCGPPGSGKTMTLFSALRKLPNMEVVGLNFSSATTPELVLKTFEQYCEYRKTPNGVVLSPIQIGKWIVLFCDEINLPATDKYGTQKVISFLRQLVELGGYWRTTDKAWVKLERIQFVGACNPPTDPGRVPLSHRFLRHAPLVMVDYPGETSLKQIYGTFNRALLKVIPNLRAYSEPLTAAMVEFYLASQKRFTTDIQAHYVYSPRELTRWMRGIYEAIRPLDTLSVEGLVRVWAHEALRLFQDRLVGEEERTWTDENIDQVAMTHFPSINQIEALQRPILFSNWTSKNYVSVDREQLRQFTKARLRVFYEEELDVALVLFDDVLDHVLRIDRVFRQVQGHLLLIGVSGSGKTTLSRFVAWINGLSIFQIKVHNKYTGDDFDEDLRTVLRRAGCKGEKICFIMDESNVLDSGFLERMNTLLANAEVPGLFEGDEHSALMTACKEGAQRDGLMLDSHEELYRWFTQQVAKNLHVVFTMNPPENGLASRAATSPALFNRCVLDWFGDWSDQAFFQVGMEFTTTLDLDVANYAAPPSFPVYYRRLELPPVHRTAVVNALVYVQMSLYDTNTRLSRRQGRHNYVTPRHYLDFISHYVRLFNEKREELEEQQRHLNVGLDKLKTTVIQVEDLRKSLAVKRTQLEAKNAEANEKLQRMVADQQEAESKKAASIQIQAALEKQKKDISQRRAVVMAELADAEPAVADAQAAVSNIKKQQLTEVRSMANPPEAVKLAMESVCTILGHRIDSWKTIQGIIRRDDFKDSIVNYDTGRQMTRTLREKMKSEFLSRPGFDFENVNRASKACGPIVKWVTAQVRFAEILDKVGPLRNEVQSLEDQADNTKDQASAIITMISELEASIARYKDEYALLISETQAIKSEMERVQTKVDRSITLLDSLGSEKGRWEAGSKTFETQMSTIAGDCLLSAAFLAYGGFFDQQYREAMWQGWASHLDQAGIKFKAELSLPEYLSTADDRLTWQSQALPADDLCVENAIMLQNFNRYPLIIDPTGQATTFLMNHHSQSKMTVTSFLDEAFLKNLESALRFGTPILVQDVEHLDPILNAVLNKETRKAGGRNLIRLGNQDIDLSPTFTMFLSTRDPSINFSPDICSRVTFVNFTMTRSSLQSQCLNQVMKIERPDADRKRTDLMKLQGEFKLRLRHLEKSLLQALNESTGNILDDDKVIDTLETLKREAAEVTRKAQETDVIMQEVEAVTAEYLPLAQFCSSTFFVLDQMSLLHHFYQFSLRFFYDVFEQVLLRNPRLDGIKEPQRRLAILTEDLFVHIFKRTSRALLHRDHLTLAVLLAQVRLRGAPISWDELEFDFLLEGGEAVTATIIESAPALVPGMSAEQASRLQSFNKLAVFKEVITSMEKDPNHWTTFLDAEQPESCLPLAWNDANVVTQAVRRALVIKCLRPDRLLQAVNSLVGAVFSADIMSEAAYDLANLVSHEVGPSTPICLCSVPGYDASYRVDNLVATAQTKCASVAMGSPEGFALAEQAIANAARTGSWVLLKNVHLASSWLSQLEKKLQNLSANPSFRIFLTMETNPSIPVNILRQSRILMNEPPPGIRANVLESLRGISPARLSSGPAEKARIFFQLAWLHATVQERLNFAPLGWTKTYEFNDSDFEAALNVIDAWVASTRSNIDPSAIAWDALRTLIGETIYGGRIDTEFDQRLLDSFVHSLFTPEAFELDFKLTRMQQGGDALAAPEGTKLEDYINWATKLPEQEPPAWLRLPSAAASLVAVNHGRELMSKLRRMKNLADEDDATGTAVAGSKGSAQPAWMRNVLQMATDFLQILPDAVSKLKEDGNSGTNPLFRFFHREVGLASSLVARIRRDLQDVVKVCQGELKQTNDLRHLLDDFVKGNVPSHWNKYKVLRGMSLQAWIQEFAARLAQLNKVSKVPASDYDAVPVNLGLLFHPEAYIIASQQASARRLGLPLEQLMLSAQLGVEELEEEDYQIEGLRLSGAELEPSTGIVVKMHGASASVIGRSSIRWVKREKGEGKRDSSLVSVPVYLNTDRDMVLAWFELPFTGDDKVILEQAVCLFA